ncbi:MAG: hypothetical protein KDD62_09455 [Bdellovibrionales bacterium]|nr:hypothetical protein [Bdellovibrionales bacterium]
MHCAIIDLGTNSARLFVYERSRSGAWLQVHKERSMVRLGDDLFLSGSLSEAACGRAVQAFQRFRSVIDSFAPRHIKVIATSALREARDASKLIRKLKETSQLDVQVISGEQEAAYVAEGVIDKGLTSDKSVLVVDIGGGSTEIILCRDGTVETLQSIPMGAGRAQQLFLKSVPPESGSVEELSGELKFALKRHFTALGSFAAFELGIGTSGSIRALGRIAMDRGESQTGSFRKQFLMDLLAELKSLSIQELRALPSLEERRADLIVAAALILHEVMEYFQLPLMEPSQSSLVDGVLLELVEGL